MSKRDSNFWGVPIDNDEDAQRVIDALMKRVNAEVALAEQIEDYENRLEGSKTGSLKRIWFGISGLVVTIIMVGLLFSVREWAIGILFLLMCLSIIPAMKIRRERGDALGLVLAVAIPVIVFFAGACLVIVGQLLWQK